jgi:hypothetical protein
MVEMVHLVDERRRFKGTLVAAGARRSKWKWTVGGMLLPIAGIRKAHLAPDV